MPNSRIQRLLARNKRIVADFIKMSNKKEKGVRKYTQDYIFAVLGEKYALSPKTIEAIVYGRVKYSGQSRD